MSITGIVFTIFFITIIVFIVTFIKSHASIKKKFKAIIIIFIFIGCLIFSLYLYFQRSSSFIFTKTTNLNEENINGIQLYDNISSKEFVGKYGTRLKRIDNILFDYYDLGYGLEIATNKNKQIIRIIKTNEGNNAITTSKGITIGSSDEEVFKAYGRNYYKRITDEGIPVIGYLERKRKVTIEFLNIENKVIEIRYDIASME